MDEQAPKWFVQHMEDDKRAFAERPTKEEMKTIVHEALVDFFTSKGILTKNILVTIATIVGALIVIGGGFKWLIGLFGFSLMK